MLYAGVNKRRIITFVQNITFFQVSALDDYKHSDRTGENRVTTSFHSNFSSPLTDSHDFSSHINSRATVPVAILYRTWLEWPMSSFMFDITLYSNEIVVKAYGNRYKYNVHI